MLGVYVHIPFCERKCNYCAFSSFTDFSEKERYISSLCDEIENFEQKGKSIDTLYIGGGTPSVLSEGEIEKIFSSLNTTFKIEKDCEISIECNPNSLTREKLECYKKLGINRLSIGVQSLNDKQLKFAGRLHSADEALEKISLAKEMGFENISVDLMIGFPFSSDDEFLNNAEKLLKKDIKHISIYMLQVEDNTKLKEIVQHNPELLIDDDRMAEMASKMAIFLKKNGFFHYEVSNYALKGFESKHNFKYWTGEEYVGFGLSAHSFLKGVRYANSNSFEGYYQRKIASYEVLTEDQKIEEHIMLGLRCYYGIDKTYLKSLGYNIEESVYYSDYVKKNIIIENKNKVFLNEEYYFVNNFIIVSLLPQ